MAINQERLQALTQLMSLVPNPMETVSGFAGIQQGLERQQQGREQGQRDFSRLEIETRDSRTAAMEMKHRSEILADQLKTAQALRKQQAEKATFETGRAERADELAKSQYYERWDREQRDREALKQQTEDTWTVNRITQLQALISIMDDGPNKTALQEEMFYHLGLDYMAPSPTGDSDQPEGTSEERMDALRKNAETLERAQPILSENFG
jgi:hypothetical protein